jgi:hypothetical protein
LLTIIFLSFFDLRGGRGGRGAIAFFPVFFLPRLLLPYAITISYFNSRCVSSNNFYMGAVNETVFLNKKITVPINADP